MWPVYRTFLLDNILVLNCPPIKKFLGLLDWCIVANISLSNEQLIHSSHTKQFAHMLAHIRDRAVLDSSLSSVSNHSKLAFRTTPDEDVKRGP